MLPETMKLEKIDNGRAVIVYSMFNQNMEKIYYGFQEYNGIRLMRMSKPYKEYGETIFEAQNEVKIKNTIKIEIPKDDSRISKKVIDFINNHTQLQKI